LPSGKPASLNISCITAGRRWRVRHHSTAEKCMARFSLNERLLRCYFGKKTAFEILAALYLAVAKKNTV